MGLKDQIKKLKTANAPDNIDWESRKSEYVANVDSLFKLILSWLDEEGVKDDVEVLMETKHLSEEHIGKYQVPAMTLDIKGRQIVFNPVGRNVIGAGGRVDCYRKGMQIYGVMLLLSISDATKGQWEIWWERNSLELLTKSSFEKLIDKLVSD